MELIIISIIVLFVISYTKMVDFQEIFSSNGKIVTILKEKDYDFYAKAKYGGDVDLNALYNKRLKNTGTILVIGLMFLLFNFTWINLIAVCLIIALVYRVDYSNLRSYYKKHLQQIDQLLPYYLKSIEILAQHYTIPVAISRSINTAPEVFKSGLRRMIEKIDSGDSSIDPYMAFAEEFPVRDSMRMMRLLYRLSLGEQEKKHEQLTSFSKSVSSLQAKAREIKYKGRLDAMERRTMVMMVVTGGGSLLLLLISIFMLISI
jgi:hypothetical protein